MSTDPLLQPFKLKHLTLRNRLMTSSHEPAYPEDGMPKGRYRAYHAERAKAGIALTVTAGSAAVAKDSPPVFNNILAYKDEVVPWMRELVDECHGHGAAVMIQLTHLGRRTRWDKADWLPVVAPTHVREPAHRAFPKLVEDWDIARITHDFADAAERGHPQRARSQGRGGREIGVHHRRSRSAGDMSPSTAAARMSPANPSSCSAVAGICGNRGDPTPKPSRLSPALDIVTPPSRDCASLSGLRVTLILRAVAMSPELKAVIMSRSWPAARCPHTLTNPTAPTASQGRFRASSPE